MVPSAYLRVFQPLDGVRARTSSCTGSATSSRARAPRPLRPRYADHDRPREAGRARAGRGGARRGPRRSTGGPTSARGGCACACWRRCSRSRDDRAARAVGPVRAEAGGSARPHGARQAAPSRSRARCAFVPPEPVARADPMVRAVRRRRALAGRGRARPHASALPRPPRVGRCAAPSSAVPVLRRADLGPISELILDLHQWIAGFDPGSLLELDYATLCDFMTWDELDDDHSARDIHEALEALERGEFPQVRRRLPGRA